MSPFEDLARGSIRYYPHPSAIPTWFSSHLTLFARANTSTSKLLGNGSETSAQARYFLLGDLTRCVAWNSAGTSDPPSDRILPFLGFPFHPIWPFPYHVDEMPQVCPYSALHMSMYHRLLRGVPPSAQFIFSHSLLIKSRTSALHCFIRPYSQTYGAIHSGRCPFTSGGTVRGIRRGNR